MTTQKTPAKKSYQAPRIESVLTPEEIEREALYAGLGTKVKKAE